MKCSTGTNLSLIEEAARDITWVLGQLRIALDVVGDKGKKRELDIGPEELGDLTSAKRYLILVPN
jgi:hypothetical protein